ncbi:MAG: SusD/RagB family nutrient-binding outer membrane lipoprotein, partial [Bacteroidia bacterium]|nr:SusD/RagB family nutrient-binding outer membrane lipoprotein [Bacteroidia bacterium]
MKRLYSFLLVIALMLHFTACKDYIEGFEDDPNNPDDAPLSTLVTTALVGSIVALEGEDSRLAAMWSQQFTGSDRQYSGYNVYNLNAEAFDWGAKFYATIQQANIAIEKAQEINNRRTVGIMKVVKANVFGNVA